MAPLTWRNVDAPNFSGVNQALALAAQNFNSGMGAGIDALGSFQEGRTINDSNQLALDVMKFQDPAAYRAALMNGTVQSNVDPRNLNADAINFMAGYEGKLIGNQQAGANLVGTNLNNTAQSFNNDQDMKSAARAEQARAAALQAGPIMAQIRALAASGNPADKAKADQMTLDNAALFTAAGSNTLEFMGNNTTAFTGGMGVNRSVAEDQDFWKGRLNNKTSDQIVDDLRANTATPEDAIRAAQAAGLPADILRSVTADISSNASTYFTKAAQTPWDAILNPTAAPAAPGYVPEFVQYANQGAKRNDPLAPELVNTMSFLPELGVTMEVVSGGQENNTTNGTGSTRHNHGNAGDVKFKVGNRTLSWENEQDIPLLQQIVARGRANGLTGIGGGPGYMNPETTHIGFGNEAVWGAEGGSPYPALAEAFNSTKPGSVAAENRPQYQQMLDTVANGGNYQAPIDINKPQIVNDDGTVSTEQVITTQIDGAWINIPTIVRGQPFTEEEAIDLFKSGQNPAVGAFQTLKDAENAAEERTDEVGRMLANAAATTATQGFNGNSAVPVATPPNTFNVPSTGAPSVAAAPSDAETLIAQVTPTPVQQAQTITNSAGLNQAFNPNAPINAQIANPPNPTEDKAAVVKRLADQTGVPSNAMTEAINQIIQQHKVSPAVAGILAANAVEARDIGDRWGNWGILPWRVSGDDFGSPTQGRTAPRVNMETVAATIEGYRNGGDISEGVAQLTQQQNAAQIAPTAAVVVQAIQALDQWYVQQQAAAEINPAINLEAITLQYEANRAALEAKLQQVGADPAGLNNVRATTPMQ